MWRSREPAAGHTLLPAVTRPPSPISSGILRRHHSMSSPPARPAPHSPPTASPASPRAPGARPLRQPPRRHAPVIRLVPAGALRSSASSPPPYVTTLRELTRRRQHARGGPLSPPTTQIWPSLGLPKASGKRLWRRRQRKHLGHGVFVDPGGRPRDAEGSRGLGQCPQQDPERHRQEPTGPQAVHHPVDENELVLKELELLSDGANVYKLIRPVLLKQDLVKAKASVKKRIEYISVELKQMDRALKDLKEKQNNNKELGDDTNVPDGSTTNTLKKVAGKRTRRSPTKGTARKLFKGRNDEDDGVDADTDGPAIPL